HSQPELRRTCVGAVDTIGPWLPGRPKRSGPQPDDERVALSPQEGIGVMKDLDAMLPLGVPLESLALYSRWWALETWLRELIYIELRAKFGSAWTDEISKAAGVRQTKD